MPRIQAVIFDLDDTLYPERAYVISGFAAVAASFEDRLGNAAETTAQMQRLFDTEHRPRVFNALLAERDLSEDEQLIRGMIDTYRTHKPIIALHPDADASLQRLCGRCKLGLISDGPPGQQWAKIEALGLRTRLDEIIITSELGPQYGKPHVAAFELMAKRLSIEHPQCAYVADNPTKDFIAPNALGWMTVQISRPDGIYHNQASPEGGASDHIISTLHNLDSILQCPTR